MTGAVEALLDHRGPVVLVTHAGSERRDVLAEARDALAARSVGALAPPSVQIKHEGGFFPAMLSALAEATATIVSGRTWPEVSKQIARGIGRAVGRQLPGAVAREVLGILRDRVGENAVGALEASLEDIRRELFAERALQEDISAATPTLRSDVLVGFVTALSELEPGAELILTLRGGERLREPDRLLLVTTAEGLAEVPCRLWIEVAVRDTADREAVRWLTRETTRVLQLAIPSREDTAVLLGGLDADARVAARRLAVLAEPWPAGQVAALLGVPVEEWFELRDRLVRAGAWADTPSGDLWFDERHRAALLEGLAADERQTYAAAAERARDTAALPSQSPLAARRRPLKGGYSIGHGNVTAGTACCLVRDRDRRERVYLLSATNVLAPPGAREGDPILQPGPWDGGRAPHDTVGILDRWLEPLERRTENLEGALALVTDPYAVSPEIEGLGTLVGAAAPEIGMRVRMVGRTSGERTGTIRAVHAEVDLGWWEKRVIRFADVITSDPISRGGDSGAILVADDQRAVGMVIGGGTNVTVALPIRPILDALNVSLLAYD